METQWTWSVDTKVTQKTLLISKTLGIDGHALLDVEHVDIPTSGEHEAAIDNHIHLSCERGQRRVALIPLR